MSLSAFCTQCRRTVYVDDEATAICPVCSNPLVTTIDPPPDATGEDSEEIEEIEEISGQEA
ncbi:MAG TPA: hypothetical protein VNC78_10210 [Actinomycetota bacterium]|nr:hypothetical protein [Actinomycetota bacterium]